MAEKASQKELQEKYLELQMIAQQRKLGEKQLEQLESQKAQLIEAQDYLDDISKTKTGTEILVPIVSGIFAKAELKNTEQLSVNVGNNIVVGKSIPEVKEMLKKQDKELADFEQQLTAQMGVFTKRATELEMEMQHLLKAKE